MGSGNSSSVRINQDFYSPVYIERETSSEKSIHQEPEEKLDREPEEKSDPESAEETDHESQEKLDREPEEKSDPESPEQTDHEYQEKTDHEPHGKPDQESPKQTNHEYQEKPDHKPQEEPDYEPQGKTDHKHQRKIDYQPQGKPDYEHQERTDQFDLNRLAVPIHISHIKPGNTLGCNDHVLIIQDGSTTIEFCSLPKFQKHRVSWRFGLIRDIIWCSKLEVFILLTRDGLYSISPKWLLIPEKAINRPPPDFTIRTYAKITPYTSNTTFWRCTCVGTTIYIVYSGWGAVIDEYSLGASSCVFVNRWTPPKTCATYEGIWCIRYHPDTDQLGFTIMDAKNNQWRMEVRSREKFAPIWQVDLPLTNGDCEICPLSNEEWLIVNGCGVRLVQVANKKFSKIVEYARELRNAAVIKNLYFIIRTKNTLEIHQVNR